ncbi:putative leucine-rich repeat-containing protein DDB_G0290503 [Centruroides sculpturatus]|uniref:putative leucine-rich repeat-containing protein DDB_G0290503 n=1 Tax=Centruroides sculpturatus TaxID=218467 RepID=UPI000C6DFE48|nr:putative leucine-rich repeat-containing protein DDB_G0290503 [Centruroides sculpturatus]
MSDESLQLIDKEIRDLYDYCIKNGMTEGEILKAASPLIRSIQWEKVKKRFFAGVTLIIVIGICISLLLYDPVFRMICMLGRLFLIKILPFWDWTYLYRSACFISNPFYTAPGLDESDCQICEDLSGIDVVNSTTSEVVMERYLKNDIPFIVNNATKGWAVNENFNINNITKIYLDELESNDEVCMFQTNLKIDNHINLLETLTSHNLLNRWYAHCDFIPKTLNDIATNFKENTQKTKTENEEVAVKLQVSENKISNEDNHFCEKIITLPKEDSDCTLKHCNLKFVFVLVSEQLKKEKDDNITLKIILKQNNDGFKKIQDLYIQEIKMLQSILNRKQIQQLYSVSSIRKQKEKQHMNFSSDPVKESITERISKFQDVHSNQSYSPLLRNFEDYHESISKNSSLPSNLNKVGLYNYPHEKTKFRSIGNLTLNNEEDSSSQKSSKNVSSNESVMSPNIKEKEVVNNSDEKLLRKELEQLRHKMNQPCEMCRNYEIQLQQKQKLEQQHQKELDRFQQIQEQYKQDLQKEQIYRTEMEQAAIELAKNSEKEIIDLLKRLESNEKLLYELKSDFSFYKESIQEQLKQLCNFIEELKAEVCFIKFTFIKH